MNSLLHSKFALYAFINQSLITKLMRSKGSSKNTESNTLSSTQFNNLTIQPTINTLFLNPIQGINFIIKHRMHNIDVPAYYDQISTMRNQIITKLREKPAEAVQKYLKDDHPPTPTDNQQSKEQTQQPDLRPPLQLKGINQQNVSQRVKQLDAVSEKIKQMLGKKRESFSGSVQRQKPPVNKENSKPTHKRIVSLFDNENKIIESKVDKLDSDWASKQNSLQQKGFWSVKDTAATKFLINETAQTNRLRVKQAQTHRFSSYRGQRPQQPLNSVYDSKRYRQDIFKKQLQSIFGDVFAQPFPHSKTANSIILENQPEKRDQLAGPM